MTSLEETIREAFGAKADQIPPDTVPPLHLPARRRSLSLTYRGDGRKGVPARRSRPGWLAPAASVVLVTAVIAGSLALSHAITGRRGSLRHQQEAAAAPAGVPRYYVALTGANEGYPTSATAAVVRATATGTVIARVVPPRPYATFTGVAAAANDRTFVLSAQVRTARSRAVFPDARFFILRIDPASDSPGGRARLQALPARYVPAGLEVSGMALSPDGALLAATIGNQLERESELYVFDLATGTQRAWSSKLCSRCLPGLIGFGFGGVNVDSLSWAADGRTVAFTWAGAGQGDVRLLNTAAPGTSLLADSKLAIATPNGSGPYWRAAIITPGGRTIVAVRELAGPRRSGRGVRVRQELVKFSAATGTETAVLNHLRIYADYEQVLWTSGSGRVLVIAGARPGASAGIFHGDRYTAIPWSAGILAAAW
jgi:hypothetical protein